MKKLILFVIGILSMLVTTSCEVTVRPAGYQQPAYSLPSVYYTPSPYYQKSSGYHQGYNKAKNDFKRGHWNYNIRYNSCY